MGKLSQYYHTELTKETDKAHYVKKLTLRDGTMLQDPYLGNYKETRGLTTEPIIMPDVMFSDLYIFIISRPSEFTWESLKAYKTLGRLGAGSTWQATSRRLNLKSLKVIFGNKKFFLLDDHTGLCQNLILIQQRKAK